jgi:UDP-2,4-diacetamido-2,4,6-trideoxy-beta-L-altropyranose hydrolase
MTGERLLLRADANEQQGTGHVMRSLALAQAWKDAGGEVSFASSVLPMRLEDRLKREGISVEHVSAQPGSGSDANATANLARRLGARRIACDGYAFGQNYQRSVREAGILLLIDDTGELGPYEADLVLNQNLHAREALYTERARHTELLLGPRYALLRREFRQAPRTPRPMPDPARRILVTMGGSDPVGVTAPVLRALAPLTDTEITVVVGPANRRRSEIEAAAAAMGCCEIAEGIVDVTGLFAWAELAVVASGSTCWELAFNGIPFVTLAVADNQRLIAESLERAGVSRHAGWHADLDERELAGAVARLAADGETRAAMTAAGRQLVDGLGAERVARQLAGVLAL